MSDNALIVWLAAITCVMVLLCKGEPDIVDSIIKRLNDAQCHVENASEAPRP